MRVFLSVAGPDRPKVEAVALALRGEGFEVFLDEQVLAAGENYNHRIRKEILRADLVVFFISPTSIAPGRYTLSELGIMKDRWKHPMGRVLPVMLEPVSYKLVPTYLQAVNVFKPPGNLAASVSHEVCKMAAALGSQIEPPQTTKQLETIIVAALFFMLTAVICGVLNGQVLSEGEFIALFKDVMPDNLLLSAFIVSRASVLAILLALAALFLNVRKWNHYAALFMAAIAAYITQMMFGQNIPVAIIDMAKSCVFVAALAAMTPAFKTPVAGVGFVIAGLFGGIIRQAVPDTNPFIWEALMVAASILVVSAERHNRKRIATG
ncbi:MAG: toll/interleukin-1 receptor domain-containing protein [Hyphomicrobiaceae bacterium]